jgi:hypothetical protein
VPRRTLIGIATLAAGCTRSLDCAAELDPHNRSLVRVSWTSPRPGTSWVEFAVDGEPGGQTPRQESLEGAAHSAGLLGLPPLSDVDYVATTQADGRTWTCAGTIRTQNVPSDLPGFELEVWDEDRAAPHPWLVAAFEGPTPGIVILRRDGRPVWYMHGEQGEAWIDVQPVAGTSRLVHNVQDAGQNEDIGVIREIDLEDSVATRTWRTPGAHHMFAQIRDGFAYTAVDVRDWYDPEAGRSVRVVGEALTEVRQDGTTAVVSSTWDWLPVEKNPGWDAPFYPDGFDWTHANALKPLPEDRYLLSLGHPGLVVELDGVSGLPLSTFGNGGDHPLPEGSMPWDLPHDPTLLDDGNLLVFVSDARNGRSGAVEYALGPEDGALREVWRVGFDVKAIALGQAIRLDNGNTLVNFGTAGLLREYAPDGQIVWSVATSSGSWFGQVRLVQDLYAGE